MGFECHLFVSVLDNDINWFRTLCIVVPRANSLIKFSLEINLIYWKSSILTKQSIYSYLPLYEGNYFHNMVKLSFVIYEDKTRNVIITFFFRLEEILRGHRQDDLPLWYGKKEPTCVYYLVLKAPVSPCDDHDAPSNEPIYDPWCSHYPKMTKFHHNITVNEKK